MKFTVSKIDLERLMRVCGLTVQKDWMRPALRMIGCKIVDETLIATSLNGWQMNQITTAILVSECNDTETFTLPIIKIIKESAPIIEIEVLKTETIVNFGLEKHIYRNFEGEFVKDADIWPKKEKVFSISVSPKRLIESLKSFKDSDYVDIDFYGEVDPILITSNNIKALVLPARRRK